MADLIPLQILSSFSLLQSTLTLEKIIEEAKKQHISSLCLADKNVLYGAVDFYKACRNNGIHPVIGITLELGGVILKEKEYPVILLAKNFDGYQALMKLSTLKMSLKDKELLPFSSLSGFMEDVFAILPLKKGEAEEISFQDPEKAEAVFSEWKKSASSGQLFLGVSKFYSQEQLQNDLFSLPSVKELPFSAVDEINAAKNEDLFPLKVLRGIREGSSLSELKEENLFMPLDSLKEAETEYKALFGGHPIENTFKIAQNCQLEIPLHQSLLPRFPLNEQDVAEIVLREKCLQGLKERVHDVSLEYEERLRHELSVINKMGFADYFLIVWDLIRYARSKNILTGAGRGSAAGSLVAYCLYITDIDPIEYKLLFERFLNEARKNMPDIDLDFPDESREEMLQYTKRKYGNLHASQIATFGTLAAKMAIRDTGRVMGFSQEEMNKWSKMIPSDPGITLAKALEQSKSLQQFINENGKNELLFKTARTIEGLPRHVGTHAAGVVISEKPLDELVPLQNGNGVLRLTQYTMKTVEEIGLLKMDFLGLKNLTILSHAVELIKTNSNSSFVLETIPLNDEKTYRLFREGKTNGIFQFESAGIKKALQIVKPYDLEDVASVNALYRPGPMEQIRPFADRKNGKKPIEYPHQDLKDILENTYGIMVYQEQIMLVASKMAGYSLGEADLLRRAISKKEKKVLKREREHFLDGAKKKGYTVENAGKVYDYIERFADYGFNRSHAIAYSLIAYQMAYLKVHYPSEFFTSILNASLGNQEKIQSYIREAQNNQVQFSSIDINRSKTNFSLEKNMIQIGFLSVKGLRRDFIKHILDLRKKSGPFLDFIDFARRIESRWRKEEWLAPLIYTGAFDQNSPGRASLIASLDSILSSVQLSGKNIELFELLEPKYEMVAELSLEEKLDVEYEYTGLYLSGHPTEFYTSLRSQMGASYIIDLSKNKSCTIIASIRDVKKIKTKKGEPMAFAGCQDVSGNGSLVLFPSIYRKYATLLEKNNIVCIEGKVEESVPAPKIIVNKIVLLTPDDEKKAEDQRQYFIKLTKKHSAEKLLTHLEILAEKYPGEADVIIYEEESRKKIKLKFKLSSHKAILSEIEKRYGKKNVVLR